ncbi:MliC family protein [Sandaracinobacter neustonicus]|uniref:MliC family protein n=1 Tax=Sandaracinobacter neustonicus TaxID=1715348 RepID=UPI0015E30425|nr:MliC family protein [Sandaracinobacter neustonicus]
MTKPILFAGLAAAALLAGCNKPAAAPEAPAPEATAVAPEAVPAPEAAAPAAPAELPTDHTTPAQKAEVEKAAADAGVPATKQSRTTFVCDNEETIEVRFFPDQGIAVLVRGGQNVELNQEPTASGFKYSNGQTTIQGKGDELMLNVGMMATAKCKAKGA